MAALVVFLLLIFHKSPPPPVPTDPQAPARLESKLRDSQSAASAGEPHQLRLDSPEVNALLDSSLAVKRDAAPAGSPLASPGREADPSLEEVQSSVKDVKINLLEDRVQAYVLFDFHGRDMSLLLEGRLRVENGYLRFEPTEGKLGSLPLPLSTLESAVSKLMSSPENREKLRVPPEISDIRIERGDLVVAYK